MATHTMSFGKYRGEPPAKIPTAYALWLVSQDHIRFSRRADTAALLNELRDRFAQFDRVLAELLTDKEPPAYYKTREKKHRIAPTRAMPNAAAIEKRAAALLAELERRAIKRRIASDPHFADDLV